MYTIGIADAVTKIRKATMYQRVNNPVFLLIDFDFNNIDSIVSTGIGIGIFYYLVFGTDWTASVQCANYLRSVYIKIMITL